MSEASTKQNTQIITVNVKTIGTENVTSFKVPQDMKISEFRKAISEKFGYDQQNTRIIYCGQNLRDESTLSESKIDDGKTVHVLNSQFRPNSPPDPQDDLEQPHEQQRPLTDAERKLQNLAQIQLRLSNLLLSVASLQSDLNDPSFDPSQPLNRLIADLNSSAPMILMNTGSLINANPQPGQPIPGQQFVFNFSFTNDGHTTNFSQQFQQPFHGQEPPPPPPGFS